MKKIVLVFCVLIAIGSGIYFYTKPQTPLTPNKDMSVEEKEAQRIVALQNYYPDAEYFINIPGQNFSANTSRFLGLVKSKQVPFILDQRKWNVVGVYEVPDKNIVGIEIMPAGSSPSNWQESMMIKFYPPTITSVEIATMYSHEIKQEHKGLKWRTLRQGKDGIIYDWTVVNVPGSPDMTEIGKFFTGEEGSYHVFYVNKRTADVETKRMRFLSILANL